MHEKGISSCTTNTKWEESRLWTVSWAIIPASGYLPDLPGSSSPGRISAPIREFASVVAAWIGVNFLFFSVPLVKSSWGGWGGIWEFKINSLFGRKMSSQFSNTRSFGQVFLPTPFPTVPSWDCLQLEEGDQRKRGVGSVQLTGSCYPPALPALLSASSFFFLFQNQDILLHNHCTNEQIQET